MPGGQGTLLATWFHFNPKMDAQLSVGWAYLSIPSLQRLLRWSLGMDKSCDPTFYNECNYLYMLGLKLFHVSKRGPCGQSDDQYKVP